jgi:hypothetical protein
MFCTNKVTPCHNDERLLVWTRLSARFELSLTSGRYRSRFCTLSSLSLASGRYPTRRDSTKKPPVKYSTGGSYHFPFSQGRLGDYMSMPPGIARGLSSSCNSEISASVVSIKPAIDAAFCNAQRVTFAGSIIPAATRSSKVSVSAL